MERVESKLTTVAVYSEKASFAMNKVTLGMN